MLTCLSQIGILPKAINYCLPSLYKPIILQTKLYNNNIFKKNIEVHRYLNDLFLTQPFHLAYAII